MSGAAPPDAPRTGEVEQRQVRGCTDGDARPVEPEDRGRPGGHALEERLQREQSRLDEVGVERGERGLEADDAERRRLERDVLLLRRVRRMVGRDRGDRPVAQRVDQRGAVVVARGAAGSSSRSGRACARLRR